MAASLGVAMLPVAAQASSCYGGQLDRITGTNLTFAQTAAALANAAAVHHVPPQALKAIAYAEGWDYQTGGRWRQYHSDGTLIMSFDCGIGVMQLTGTTAQQFDLPRLGRDPAYNIDAGATVLGHAGARPFAHRELVLPDRALQRRSAELRRHRDHPNDEPAVEHAGGRSLGGSHRVL
jgi:hypothetical protein